MKYISTVSIIILGLLQSSSAFSKTIDSLWKLEQQKIEGIERILNKKAPADLFDSIKKCRFSGLPVNLRLEIVKQLRNEPYKELAREILKTIPPGYFLRTDEPLKFFNASCSDLDRDFSKEISWLRHEIGNLNRKFEQDEKLKYWRDCYYADQSIRGNPLGKFAYMSKLPDSLQAVIVKQQTSTLVNILTAQKSGQDTPLLVTTLSY